MKKVTLLIISLFIICCFTVNGSSDPQWSHTVIKDGKTFEFLARGFCSDNQGRLHLTYGESALYYAMYDGSMWTVECVDELSRPGRGASITIDSQGQPWICYTDHLTATLKLARKETTGWQISMIDENISLFVTATVKLDSSDVPCVGYARGGESEILVYADYHNSQWQFHVFEEFYRYTNAHCRLELNARQEPYIQCEGTGYYRLENEWKSFDIGANDIMIDQNHFLHWLKVSRYVEYNHSSLVNSHDAMTRFDTANSRSDLDYDCSLLLDDQNQLTAFYLRQESHIMRATKTGISWHEEKIYTIPKGTSAAVGAVCVNGTFHVVLFDEVNGTMLHLENSSGQWNSSVIDREETYSKYHCFDLDSDDVCHVVYTDKSTDTIYYMNNSQGNWETTNLGIIDGISSVPMCLRAEGGVLIGFHDPDLEELCLFEKTSSGFIRTNLPGYYSEIYALNVLKTVNGIYYYVYQTENGWFVTHNAFGDWQLIPVELSDPCSLTESSVDLVQSHDGHIYLGISNLWGNPLRYIFEVFNDEVSLIETPAGWSTNFTRTTPCALSVDRFGYLHDFRVVVHYYGKGDTADFFDYTHYFYEDIGHDTWRDYASDIGDVSMATDRNGNVLVVSSTKQFTYLDTLTSSSSYEIDAVETYELPEGGRPQPVTVKLDSRDYPVVCHSQWGDLMISRKLPATVDLQLDMPNVYFEPGSDFMLELNVLNTGDALNNVSLWCVLEIADQFYYWPGWTLEPDFRHVDIPVGESTIQLIESFPWPITGEDIIGRNRFYAAVMNHDNTDIQEESSGVETWTFNYGPALQE